MSFKCVRVSFNGTLLLLTGGRGDDRDRDSDSDGATQSSDDAMMTYPPQFQGGGLYCDHCPRSISYTVMQNPGCWNLRVVTVPLFA